MSIQSSPSPKTIEICSYTLDEMTRSNCELQTINELERQKNLVHEQAIEILQAEKIALNNRCTKLEREKIEEGRLIQLIEEDLQSSKTTLQWSYAIGSVLLSCRAV